MYDIVFRNARVFDGTGAPWFVADVAVKNGIVVKVGVALGDATEVVSADGRCISPGFIDAHSHSDEALISNPSADSKVMQGVTLEVIGQCGDSATPRKPGSGQDDGQAAEDAGRSDRADWTDLLSYAQILEINGVSVNVAPLVGHGTVRRYVMGEDRRSPTRDELSSMERLVEEAMEQGSFGLSTGLIYVPGTYSNTQEILALNRVVSRHGGIYFTHLRNEGSRLLEALDEAIRIGTEAGTPVQICHFKIIGKANWGRIDEAIDKVEMARRNGLDITADQYPYIASSTGLSTSVPSEFWAGGREEAFRRFRDPRERRQLLKILSEKDDWGNLVIASLSHPDQRQFIGKNLLQIGTELGLSPGEACLDLLLKNSASVQIVNFGMSEDDVQTVMSLPWVMPGSDASGLDAEKAEGQPHPRAYGTFVRILGKYVREMGHLRLEEAIRKMTSLPAMRLGLQDRGILREGMKADLVLFDANTVIDNATYVAPHQYPSGVDYVVVNGEVVVRNGKHTGKRPGAVLRRTR